MQFFLLVGWLIVAFYAAGGEPAPPAKAIAADKLTFVAHRIGSFRSEACCVGDFNNDGKLDVVAGPYLNLGPDWKSQKIRELRGQVNDKGLGYYDDFMNIAMDVNGDGLLDVVAGAWFARRTTWYRNPGKFGDLWEENLVDNNGNNECGDAWDLLGTGRRDVIIPSLEQTIWYERGIRPDGSRGLVRHVVCEKRMPFGVGVGDVNGDGRPDILRPTAWFEAPEDPRQGRWREHPLSLGGRDGKIEHTPQIFVYDVNGDNLPDVITSSAHRYGIFWYEQVRKNGEIAWNQHLIDDTWTQAHALALADLDRDGVPELITGKRFMAHNGNDPEEHAPLGVYWYKLRRGKTPTWTKHVISYEEGIGAGLNIEVVDLDGDGDLDVVVTGKWGGPVWFENRANH